MWSRITESSTVAILSAPIVARTKEAPWILLMTRFHCPTWFTASNRNPMAPPLANYSTTDPGIIISRALRDSSEPISSSLWLRFLLEEDERLPLQASDSALRRSMMRSSNS